MWWFLLIQKVGVVVFINSEGGCGGFFINSEGGCGGFY